MTPPGHPAADHVAAMREASLADLEEIAGNARSLSERLAHEIARLSATRKETAEHETVQSETG